MYANVYLSKAGFKPYIVLGPTFTFNQNIEQSWTYIEQASYTYEKKEDEFYKANKVSFAVLLGAGVNKRINDTFAVNACISVEFPNVMSQQPQITEMRATFVKTTLGLSYILR